jgi:hypothetical protein
LVTINIELIEYIKACAYNGTEHPSGSDFYCVPEVPELECYMCVCHCTDGVIDDVRICPLAASDCPPEYEYPEYTVPPELSGRVLLWSVA